MLGFVRVIRCLSIALRSHPRPAQPTLAFGINVSDYSFADAVALSGFGENFDDFLAGLAAGEYYVNIHTDTFNAGEIRGQIGSASVSAVPLPESALLPLAGLGGLAGLRRKTKS